MAKAAYKKPDIYVKTNPETIKALVSRNLDLIEGLCDDIRDKMLTILSEGLSQGKGIDEIIDEMEEAGFAYGYAAERIARTEIMYGLNEGALDRYKDDRIEKVQWLAGPDDRICEDCEEMDGTIYPIDEAPELPLHPCCRCVLTPVIE